MQAPQHVNQAGDIAEEKQAERVTLRPRLGEPKGRYQRRQREPAEAAQVHRREAQGKERAAQDGA